MTNIGIIGAGKFGTAIAFSLTKNTTSKKITIYDINEKIVNDINENHKNSSIFADLQLPNNITALNKLDESIKNLDIIFLAVSSNSLREIITKIKNFINSKTCIINLAKGFEQKTLKTPSQVFEEVLGNGQLYGTLSGPNFANEIVEGDPTATVVASKNQKVPEMIKRVLASSFFRIYPSSDVIGVEICGAVKNVLAIASGLHESLELGWNSKAALITRGIAEISRIQEKMGGDKNTLLGLSGMGDILLTTTSSLSRNFQFGYLVGKGKTKKEALDEINSTVEGLETINTTLNLAKKHDIEMPIAEIVSKVLEGQITSKKAITELMER